MVSLSKRFEMVNIDKLKPYEKNARTHSPEQIKQLQKSIQEFGFVNPCLIDGKYNIIAGHGRVLAARAEGLTELPCVCVEHLTKAQQQAYIIADNKLALNAGWDTDMLLEELTDLQELDFDLDLIGFSELELGLILDNDGTVEDEFDVNAELENGKPPITKLGDIWQLGNHRLMCGDSTDKETVMQLMGGGYG